MKYTKDDEDDARYMLNLLDSMTQTTTVVEVLHYVEDLLYEIVNELDE